MRRPPAPRSAGRRGAYAIALALLFTVLIGSAALAIDLAWVQLSALQTQNASDAGAHAAAVALRAGDSRDEARAVAVAVMEHHEVAGEPVTVDPWQDVVFGHWDWAAGRFDPTSSSVNAVNVRVRRTDASPDGAVGLLIGLFGDEAAVTAPQPATAAIRARDVVVVVDVGAGWGPAWPAVREGLDALARTLAQRPGDRVALVAFTGEAWTVDPPGPVAGAAERWAALAPCGDATCARTPGRDPGAGLDEALRHLDGGLPEAIGQVLLVTSGLPRCAVASPGGPDYCARREILTGAVSAADAADAAGVTVSVVAWRPGGRTFASSLVTRDGRLHEPKTDAELVSALTGAIPRPPVAIVQ